MRENNNLLWQADCGKTFKNPIIFADYSDPDAIRVGDTFYMTASSFNYMPGLPILTSKDLINWTLVNYAIDKIPYPDYETPAHAKGIWAPSIRFHNGMFYIFVGMPDEGIFMLKTEDPLGKWSEPYLVYEGKGYIDPCPFWDEDGKAYVVHGYAKSRIGFNSVLGIFPISLDGEKAIGEDKIIFDGNLTQKTIEGPKVYKRNEFYYIFAPAGGVRPGWQTVLRAKNIYGPYEEKIVLAQGNTEVNGPHQGALIDTPSGEEWFMHFQDRGVYGRITHLQPVVWEEDWPVIGHFNEELNVGEPVLECKKPDGVPSDITPCYLEASDDFYSTRLNLMWQWTANYKNNFYELMPDKGLLKLNSLYTCGNKEPNLWNCANILTQKIVCPTFEASVILDFSALEINEMAGFIMLGGEYTTVAVKKTEERLEVVYIESESESRDSEKVERLLYDDIVPEGCDKITFKLTFAEDTTCSMYYKFESAEEFIKIPFDSVPVDHTWVGAKIGIYSIALDKNLHKGYSLWSGMKVVNL